MHPEIYSAMSNASDFETFYKIVKTEVSPEKQLSKPRQSTYNPKPQAKPEETDEVKPPLQKVANEEPIKTTEGMGTNMLPNQYYTPMQPDMLPVTYRNSFLYGQNYGLFYMFPPASQSESLRPQHDFWINQITLSDQQYMPSIPQTGEIIQNPTNSVINHGPKQPALKVEQNFSLPNYSDETNELLARAAVLPSTPCKPLPQSDHRHIHCEFCGHSTIQHNGHIDYIHNAELHHVSQNGTLLWEK